MIDLRCDEQVHAFRAEQRGDSSDGEEAGAGIVHGEDANGCVSSVCRSHRVPAVGHSAIRSALIPSHLFNLMPSSAIGLTTVDRSGSSVFIPADVCDLYIKIGSSIWVAPLPAHFTSGRGVRRALSDLCGFMSLSE